EGGVGDPAGDQDVGAGVKACGDPETAQVGVGGQRGAQTELLGPVQQVVAGHTRDTGFEVQLFGEFGELVGEAVRVEASGVGDDLGPAFHSQVEGLAHLAQEGLGVAATGVGELVPAEDGHGEFGQVVTGEDVEGPFGEHFVDGGEAVSVET